MGDAKFTPGPWSISTENMVCKQIDAENHAICTDQFCFAPKDEKAANAHLIAAAPELYEALAELSVWYTEHTGLPAAKANAALAKARGEA